MEPSKAAEPRRSSSDDRTSGAIETAAQQLLYGLDNLGIATNIDGKVVGGVAMTRTYYQHALETQGEATEVEPCQLVLTKRVNDSFSLCAVKTEQLEAAADDLPEEIAVLAKLLSCAAVSQFKWGKVPAVAVFGRFAPEEEELEQLAALDIPVSPSMSGPHPEELITQLEVFYKQHSYPEHKCFLLRDWGFTIFAADLEEATQVFNTTIWQGLNPDGQPAELPAGNMGRSFSLATAFKRLGNLMTRASSETSEVAASPLQMSTGRFSVGTPVGSEPTTPVLGSRTSGTPASQLSSSPFTVPEEIKKIGSGPCRAGSDSYRVPAFHTGLRPW